MSTGRPTVVMLHVGRCGSTVVADMLGRHPMISWDGEVFEPKVRAKIGFDEMPPEDFLLDRIGRAEHVYGFEVKYLPSHHQLNLGRDLAGIIDLTERVEVSHYVTLHRHNYLRRVVSGAIGRERRRWHRAPQEPVPETKVHLNPNSVPFGPRKPLLAAFEEMKTGESALRDVLEGRHGLHLSYEDHVERDPSVAYELICDLIGVEPGDIDSRLARTGAAPLSAVLANFDEIAEHLTGTEYEWMLDKQTAS